MKNIFKTMNFKVSMFLFGLAVYGASALNVHAATDADLAAAISSSTQLFTDNKSAIVTFVVGTTVVMTGVGLAFGAIYWAKGQILSILSKRRGKRRK